MNHPNSTTAANFRNFIFGVEDSLVSTVGLLSGIAIADIPSKTILLTGIVLIFVEAFSMAVGSYLSEHSVEEYLEKRAVSSLQPLVNSLIMFFSYFVSGFIPLMPYVVLGGRAALPVSITASLIALLGLGMVGAKISGVPVWRSGLRMFLIGGAAVLIGVLVGSSIQQF
ncbi:VIT1/CCC1 transporter family protein [Candidatus Uhrbacteria bacterium]|nr:VIT1/CCC1 transporter family protein [Candidatus Uhrbacteria bacterium]